MRKSRLDIAAAVAAPESGLNGDRAALDVDRAIGEIRRGRSIAVAGPGAPLVVAAVETLSHNRLRRMLRASSDAWLLLTGERVRAARLGPDSSGPMALKLDSSLELETLRLLAGIGREEAEPPAGFSFVPWPHEEAPVLAAFGLIKAARLVPALIGFDGSALADDTLHTVSLAAILEHAASARTGFALVSEARVPLAGAEHSRVALYRDEHAGSEHVAVIIGEPDLSGDVPVRLHSACLTGDLLGSLRCDCGEQLITAVDRIAALGGGILLYLDQEGRSIGLANKLRAYAIQDRGLDTFDADHHLGFTADERSYDVAAALLQRLGVKSVRLLTNNPHKIDALREHGIDVAARLPLVTEANQHNEDYLRSKRERAGHLGDGRSGEKS